ncbi:hypothetical protein HDU97_000935 [Phlyctochytrium planicorne]|nr:hypothetical protein HDU97_000935 [Phlyctochytrium planicorne]
MTADIKDSKETIATEVIDITPPAAEAVADIPEMEQGEDKTDKPAYGKRPASTLYLHLGIWLLLTAYIIALIIKGEGKEGYVFSIVVYCFITLRLLAQHVSMSYFIYGPLGRIYDLTVGRAVAIVPEAYRTAIMGAAFVVALIVTACASPETTSGTIPQRIQSIIGLFVMLAILAVTSSNFKKIPWHTVVNGLIIQFILALFILRTKLGVDIFNFISKIITNFLQLSGKGLAFLFGDSVLEIHNFAVGVLPAIVFFCSFISIVYYLNGMQYIVAKFAWAMVRIMGTSGSESVVAAASPFVGQGESALLVRPFVEYMTMSELHSTMTSGFATIAGSVLLAYVQYTGNSDQATSTLLTACVMSVPCSLLISKMRYPETEESLTRGKVKIPENEEKDANFLHAAGNGAATGVQLILLIAGSLLAIVSLYEFANFLCGYLFHMVGRYNWIDSTAENQVWVTIGFLLSYLFTPFAVAMGIPFGQARKAAEFLANKMVVNEFYAYATLNAYAFITNKDGSLTLSGAFTERTVRLLSFGLCGFANFASIGIQIGCLGAMAPSRKKDLAALALSAMICGTFSTWITASVAGALL